MPPAPPDQTQRLATVWAGERGRLIRRLAARLGPDPVVEPEDVISDVLLRLIERADLLAQAEDLTAYLFRAAGNGLTDWLRRRRVTEPLSDMQADSAPRPDEALERTQQRHRLDAALNQLSPAEREVWVAVEVEGHAFRDLADRWGQPIGTLLSRKSRAQKALRALLGEDARPGGLTPGRDAT
jgi:RNA polymerase sigma factor (sigma-70 family)